MRSPFELRTGEELTDRRMYDSLMPSKRNAPPLPEQCYDCGRSVSPEANFCPGCGADLRAPASPASPESPAYCAECGEPFERSDEFCTNCGVARPTRTDSFPSEPIDGDHAVGREARQAFRRRVQDHLDAGWELREDHGDRVVLVDRDIGSIPIHVLLFLTTGGFGNLLYGWYHYSELAETRQLAVGEDLPPGDLIAPDDDDPLVTLSGYLLSALLLLIGSGIVAVGVGQGALLGALFGLAFAVIGLALFPPVERRLDRRHGLSRFGRIRTVDHRIIRTTERTEEPCVVCGESIDRGVVRRRRDETVIGGVPVRTHSLRHNHYCADCARQELLGDGSEDGGSGGGGSGSGAVGADVDVDLGPDADPEAGVGYQSKREESTDRETDRAND